MITQEWLIAILNMNSGWYKIPISSSSNVAQVELIHLQSNDKTQLYLTQACQFVAADESTEMKQFCTAQKRKVVNNTCLLQCEFLLFSIFMIFNQPAIREKIGPAQYQVFSKINS